jgi:integrase
MTTTHSIQQPTSRKARRRKPKKPNKPYPEFPLFPHATRRWAKKIRGKLHYFGPWGDPDGAVAKYLEQKDALHAGRTPRVQPEGLTVRDLVNRFLTHKRHLLDTREITERTWGEYYATGERLVSEFGADRLVDDLTADAFGKLRSIIAAKWGPIRLANEIQRVRSVFKYGYDAGLIDKPVRYGPEFKRPAKKVLRKLRAEQGPRMFERFELQAMIGGALVVGKEGPELVQATALLRAMILLGVNCGFGNADCGTLPLSALDLTGGWVSYPRPKTGIERRCKLWPETIAALQRVVAGRREAQDQADAGLVFLTQRGRSWYKNSMDNPVSKETRKLLDALGINDHRNFYALRHTFETIAGDSRDQVAVDHVMGHAREDMASVYRERIADERLAAVAEHVRRWWFGGVK